MTWPRVPPRLALALAAAAIASTGLTALTAGPEGSGGFVVYCELREGGRLSFYAGQRIYYDFVHSANKAREVEVLESAGGSPVLKAVYFKEFGAGVPASPEDLGGGYLGEEYGFIVYRVSNPLPASMEFSWSGWREASLGGSGVWLTGAECFKAGYKALGSAR